MGRFSWRRAKPEPSESSKYGYWEIKNNKVYGSPNKGAMNRPLLTSSQQQTAPAQQGAGITSFMDSVSIPVPELGPEAKVIVQEAVFERGFAQDGIEGHLRFILTSDTLLNPEYLYKIIFQKENNETVLESLILDLFTCGDDSEKFAELYPALLDQIGKQRNILEQAEDLADIFRQRLLGDLNVEHLPTDLQGTSVDN